MKKNKYISRLFFAVLLFLIISPIKANAASSDYVINSYDIDIVVNENNTLDITETIRAYFYVPKHGIFRKIPINNEVKRLDGTVSKNRAQISNLKVKNIIIEGVGSDILDQNVIGILSNRCFGTNDDIFLAGHNIEEVFKNLHNISIGEIIKITTKNSCYRYKVVDIKIINETETSYLKNNYSNKLFLMTCTNIKRKRLLVVCDLI